MKTIYRICTAFLGSLLVVAMTGCAHPLSLTTDTNKLPAVQTRSDKGVAMYVSSENKALEVTTPGGGGDKVAYFPYRDLETGIYRVLSDNFARVSVLKSAAEKQDLAKNNLNFLIEPVITTNSSSESAFTWPPTLFTVELKCAVRDAAGATVTELRGYGEGRATFDEFKSDHSLSARRAAEAALTDLSKALEKSAALR
jgi:hypothetical protein